jgi:hypothetical protein
MGRVKNAQAPLTKRVNPIASRRDESSGPQLEAAMIVQSLGTAFILAFGAIAISGHLLLVRALFTPDRGGNARPPEERGSRRAIFARARIAA